MLLLSRNLIPCEIKKKKKKKKKTGGHTRPAPGIPAR
jgi:hypothetical protein